MPSKQLEMLIELFRHRPSLAAEVLTDALGMELPRYRQARLESAELNDIAPAEYPADAVVVLAADRPVLAVRGSPGRGENLPGGTLGNPDV
jgi:hypothetical protein